MTILTKIAGSRPSVLKLAEELNDYDRKRSFKGWNYDKALATLGFHEEPLPHELWGDRKGDSQFTVLRINPEVRRPQFVVLHELAHLVLRHGHESAAAGIYSPEMIARHEAEAERVAIALADELGVEFNRERALVHMTNSLAAIGQTHFTPAQAERILHATQMIRRAGRG